jgi:diguanylate cyclase (GGDEF)-like protein
VFEVLAFAFPLSLALVFVMPDGPLLREGLLGRALVVLSPFAVLGGIAQWGPGAFAKLTGLRLPVPPELCRCPHLAVAFALPLAGSSWLKRNRRIRPFLHALLPALVPFWFAVHVTLAAWWKAPTATHLGLAFSASSLLLLHAILDVTWGRVYLDELTGLFNRRALEEDLARLSGPYTLAMIDVDRFKDFNDRWGHTEGDHVLRMIAARLRQDLGAGTYRWGGEEFCVVLEGADADAAARRLDAARQRIASHPFGLRTHTPRRRAARGTVPAGPEAPQPLTVTISIGVTAGGGKTGTPAQAVKRADDALYRAKAEGRNRVVFAD